MARRDGVLFAAAIAVFCTYAVLFIFRTSFVVGGERYFSLFDDAMISMRYARNLAHGYGLVWNPGGERVEGYTNPLWVFYMALVHLLPIPPSKTSLVIQITAVILLVINLCHVRRIASAVSGGSRMTAWGAVVLTGSYLPINNWSLQGMEVSLLLVLTSTSVWLAIRSLDTGRFQKWLYPLLGLGTLVRPDAVVLLVAFLSFFVATDPVYRRKHAQWGSIVLLVALGAQTAIRSWYYHDVLPNTYYLKMTGVPAILRVSRGFYVFVRFAWKATPLLFALPFVIAFGRDRRIRLISWTILAQVAYSVYVGGDAWEYWGGSNRYLSVVMPEFFVLMSYAICIAASALVDAASPAKGTHAVRTKWPALAFALWIALAAVSLNSIHGVEALLEALLIEPPLHTGSGGENHQDVEEALLLRDATRPDATLAVARAGTIPYFADRYSIDLLGKNDRVIAREPARVSSGPGRFLEFRPGHMKFDYGHSIGRLQPDIVVQLWEHSDEAAPFLRNQYDRASLNGKCVYVRRGSPRIVWKQFTNGICT
jgi:hypothetical protein